MNEHHHIQTEKLARFSVRLEELFSEISSRGSETLPPELSDEIAVTAGEIMLVLADHRGEELVRETLDDARRLRQAARTQCPRREQVCEAGAALTRDVSLIIREERRAA